MDRVSGAASALAEFWMGLAERLPLPYPATIPFCFGPARLVKSPNNLIPT